MTDPITNSERPIRVLAVVDYYLPGYKGGGPLVSVSRLVAQLGDSIESFVFTRDRDLRDSSAYEGIKPGDWNSRPEGWVFYANPEQLNCRGLKSAIESIQPDVIYLNSYFSRLTRSALLLRFFGQTDNIAFVMAPRGEFSKGALGIKSLKKRIYIALAKLTGFHRNLLWQVSSIHEQKDVEEVIQEDDCYFMLAPDLMDPKLVAPSIFDHKPVKISGSAEFAFVSRIAPIKNLAWAIERLQVLKGNVKFYVYGPAEDRAYWSKCQEAIGQLPDNVEVIHKGPVPSSDVHFHLARHHFFLFPTQGENFGHVIPEALYASLPVLLSDRTPWRDLDEHEAGWVMPLEDPSQWESKLQACVDMNQAEYNTLSASALQYISQCAKNSKDPQKSIEMFQKAVVRQQIGEMPKVA